MLSDIGTSPFEHNLHDLLHRATKMGASDLHIEPMEHCIRIRVRIDGVLQTIQKIENQRLFDRFFMQTKRTCGFNMSKLSTPQDSRFYIQNLPFDFRASLIPTLYGEKIVLRCLERHKTFSLAAYPLPFEAKSYLLTALEKWQGLILVSGPTGSGKTTLLYSLLSELDRQENNVHTLEDPIEYTLEGIIQTQINPPEVTFENALRSLLRQDPDSILVGEIRDHETAQAALHAASTGHLIFSTIHANSATECIERLISLGIDRKLIDSNLLFASAQRLVPKICQECGYKPSWIMKLQSESGDVCTNCNGRGIKGRALLFEFIGKFHDPTGSPTLKQIGSLKESAQELLKKGEIDAKSASVFCD